MIPPIENTQTDSTLIKDEYHRIKLMQRQKLWEGRFITHEKKRPAMLKVIVFEGVKE